MADYHAVLVEDEPTAAAESRDALTSAGFTVVEYRDALSAMEGTAKREEMIDLLVLDRRLPMRFGEPPSDDIGDDLLDALLAAHPDLVVIVFSGHTGFEHAQFATAKRGVVSLQGGAVTFDRVTPFEKGQSLEFDKYVGEVCACLSRFEDIQLLVENGADYTPLDKRLLRRVAFDLRGNSIRAQALTGGLAGSPVWLCEIEDAGGPLARVVAKRQGTLPQPGGFQTLLPAHLTAGTISVVSGFCSGYFVSVQQLAGADPVPLLGMLRTEASAAGAVVEALKAGLDSMGSGQELNLPIAEIAQPFEKWEVVQNRAGDFGIHVPPGSRVARTVRSAQHGDLHPGNVLAAGVAPVVIDFDSQTFGSELLDAVALVLGALFHRDSPLRADAWPTADQCRDLLGPGFLADCPAPDYFRTTLAWLSERKRSDRELYSVVLAYAVRQLRYEDVVLDDAVRSRAIAIAHWAVSNLDES